jgi:hypothetical protein
MKIIQALIIATLIVATQGISRFKNNKGSQRPASVHQMRQSEAIHFRKIGQVIGDVHFGHLKFNIDYKLSKQGLTDACRDLRSIHTEGDRDKKYMTETRLPEKCYETLAQLTDIENIFDGLISRSQTSSQGTGHENNGERQPRQVILATAGAAIIGGVIGWITSKIWGAPKPDPQLTHNVNTLHQLQWLDHNTVIDVAREARDVAKYAKNLYYYQDAMYKYMGIMIALSRLADQTTRFRAGLTDLLHGKLSPELLSPETVKGALKKLQIKLQKKNLVLAIDNFHQAYNYPVSYRQYPNLTIVVHLHIPALREHDILDLYKFMPLPLILESEQGTAYATPLPEHQYLAINQDQSQYRVMPAADLANECSHIGDLFICRHSNLVAKKSRPNCLVALFTNSEQQIRDMCAFDFRPKNDELVQLGESTFLLFQTEASPIAFFCDASASMPPIPAETGVQQITVPAGCTAEARSFIFEAQISIDASGLDSVPIHYTPVNVSRFTRHPTPEITKIIHSLDSVEQRSVSSFKQLDALYDSHHLKSTLGLSIGPVAGFILIVSLAAFGYWLYRKDRVIKPLQSEVQLNFIPPPSSHSALAPNSLPNNDPTPNNLYPCVGNNCDH